MPRLDYVIVIVDRSPRPFAPARGLLTTGVPLAVAARWAVVRRTMNPAGLKRKIAATRN